MRLHYFERFAAEYEERFEREYDFFRLDVPHRQVVFTIPKMLRVFFKFKRKLLGDLCRHSLVRAKTKPEAERVGQYMTRPVLSLERLEREVYSISGSFVAATGRRAGPPLLPTVLDIP